MSTARIVELLMTYLERAMLEIQSEANVPVHELDFSISSWTEERAGRYHFSLQGAQHPSPIHPQVLAQSFGTDFVIDHSVIYDLSEGDLEGVKRINLSRLLLRARLRIEDEQGPPRTGLLLGEGRHIQRKAVSKEAENIRMIRFKRRENAT